MLNDVENERLRSIADGATEIYSTSLLDKQSTSILSIIFQPHNPSIQLVPQHELIDRMPELLGANYRNSLLLTGDVESLPGGVSGFSWNRGRGHFGHQLVFASGMTCFYYDILSFDKGTQEREIKLFDIVVRLYQQLQLTRTYLQSCHYSGTINGLIRISGGSGARSVPFGSHKRTYFPDNGRVRLGEIERLVDFDTNALYDQQALRTVFFSVVKDVGWALGLGDTPDVIIEDAIDINHWFE